jgi:hypothetical protein
MNETHASNSGVAGNGGTGEVPSTLNEAQKKVLDAMLRGLNMSAAAKAGDVHRVTVGRWMAQGGEFLRVLRDGQVKKLKEGRRQARSLAVHSADIVIHAIQCGDVQAAIALLKAFGVFEPVEWEDEALKMDPRDAAKGAAAGDLSGQPSCSIPADATLPQDASVGGCGS